MSALTDRDLSDIITCRVRTPDDLRRNSTEGEIPEGLVNGHEQIGMDEAAGPLHDEVPESADRDDAGRQDRHLPPIVLNATPFTCPDPTTIRPREWLYGRHYIRGFVSTTIGKPGLGKSNTSLSELIDMCSARGIFHNVQAPLRGWYIGEDPKEEIERRLVAACAYHSVTAEDLGERLFYDSTLELPALRVAMQRAGGLVLNENVMRALAAEIKARALDVLILDPLIKFHGVPESDPTSMDVVMRALSELAGPARISIDINHHTRKQSQGVTGPATMDDGRGASSVGGAVRSARIINPMSSTDATKAGIAEGDRWRYVRVDSGKANMSPPQAARWLQHVSVTLPCDESVGVIAPWQFPDAFAGVTGADVDRVRELARTGAYRADTRSEDWIGFAVADMFSLDSKDKADRAKVNHMIKTWLKNKVLDIEEREDKQRKPRSFIIPGPFNDTRQPEPDAE